MKLLVISICKNEAATIGKVIQGISRKYQGVSKVEICIIDDGSTDDTAKIARESGADLVVSDGVNKGLAFRFREALEIAIERKVDILVTIDGDLQFDPQDIPKFVTPIVSDTADFVAADRFTDPASGQLRRPANMPAGKYYGNKLGARVLSNLVRRQFRDVTSGFRAYNRKAILALNLNSNYTYTQESFQILAIKRLRILSLPTKVTYFKNRSSRVVTSIPRYIVVSGLNIMRAYRDFAPLRFFFNLGLLPMIIGVLCSGFVGWHWLTTGNFTPYKFIGFIGLYLVSLGLVLWMLGIFADMLVRLLNTQERALELAKRTRQDQS
jgi:glycosyltransferase involved in cell wall biosynthesis